MFSSKFISLTGRYGGSRGKKMWLLFMLINFDTNMKHFYVKNMQKCFSLWRRLYVCIWCVYALSALCVTFVPYSLWACKYNVWRVCTWKDTFTHTNTYTHQSTKSRARLQSNIQRKQKRKPCNNHKKREREITITNGWEALCETNYYLKIESRGERSSPQQIRQP